MSGSCLTESCAAAIPVPSQWPMYHSRSMSCKGVLHHDTSDSLVQPSSRAQRDPSGSKSWVGLCRQATMTACSTAQDRALTTMCACEPL
eukprot:scaffold2727_cov385-Prasinococcus_capsulatus_cf.AAC.1